MGSIAAYKSEKEFPKEARQGQIYIDKNKNAILVPFRDDQNNFRFVPSRTRQ